MSIVGALDIHRKQLTFDYLDTETGQLRRGQLSPADREHLAVWLRRFDGQTDVTFAVEACTGWRYVVEELRRAGIGVQLAEPADTAAARGRKRRAKSDRADCKLMRELVTDGRVPQCWIPPSEILEYRALLECYHDLRRDHTAWVQRIHAVCFHQGTAALGTGGVGTMEGRNRLRRIAQTELSPAAQTQVSIALEILETLETHLDQIRRRLAGIGRHLNGAKILTERLYGVGPITALAMCSWLGGADRFNSSRQAVRFTGLDITVYSSDGKRSPGHLSRQGPPVLRWCLYEAGKTHARSSAPDYDYYSQVKDRIDGKRAAISEARKIVRQAHHILSDLGDDAFAAA